jgi:hypothetical protein
MEIRVSYRDREKIVPLLILLCFAVNGYLFAVYLFPAVGAGMNKRVHVDLLVQFFICKLKSA